jgi:uncharacterized protein (TIGR02145 family)
MTLKNTFYLLIVLLLALSSCRREPKKEECDALEVTVTQIGSNTLKAIPSGNQPGFPIYYAWSNQVGDLSEITVSASGTYKVTITDYFGCTATNSFAYDSNACSTSTLAVSITSSVDVLANVTLTAAASQGSAPYTYLWSTGEESVSIVAPQQGVFSVIVTDNIGCSDMASINVACKNGCVGCDGVNSLTDIDGNVYDIIKIGGRCWMAENLRTTRYQDGSTIVDANDSALWYHHNYDFVTPPDTGTWCYYLKDPNNNETLGKLYNWPAATDSRGICPQGWRIPTDVEWAAMVDSVSDRNTAGTLLKSVDLWPPSDTSTNQSGFNAPPGRERYLDARFNIFSVWANFWASDYDTFDSYRASAWLLNTDVAVVYAGTESKGKGFSCRCIKE